jgi:chromosomal replication initiator protein
MEDGTLLHLQALVHTLSAESCSLALIPVQEDPPSHEDPTQTLDHFVIGPSSQSCLETIRQLVDHADEGTTPLVLCGPAGVGKTHLLRGAASALRRRNLSGPVLYRSAELLLLEMVRAILSGQLAELRATLSGCGALLVDDVQLLESREATQAELRAVLESLQERGIPILLTTDRPIAELPGVGPPLHQALRSATELPVALPEWETHAAIFLDRALGWNLQLGANVAGALASAIGGDLSRVDPLLTRAMLLRRSEKQTLELEHVRRVLAPAPLYAVRPSPEVILEVVAHHFGLRQKDLRSPERTGPRTSARQAAAYLLRTRCGLSFPDIGRRIGRHHTTALHSVKRSSFRLTRDPSWGTLLDVMEKEVSRRTERGKHGDKGQS